MIYDLNNETEFKKFNIRLNKLLTNKCKVELNEIRKKRTYKQNRYLHLLLGLFSLELGYTIVESKILFKRLNKDVFEYKKNNITFVKSSAKLDALELTKSIDKFRNWASVNGGIYLPAPDEIKLLNEVDELIKSKKQYL